MKKICLSLLLVTGVVTVFTSCRKIHGEGPAVTENRSEKNFSGIEMGIPGELYYTPGASYSIEITASRNILDIIQTHFSDNVLKVRAKPGVFIKSNEQIIVKVTAPDITSLGVSGSGDIKVIDPYQPSNIDLSASGSGGITISKLTTGNIDAKISGSGNIDVYSGAASKETLSVSGKGSIDITGLSADQANTNTSGSGTIKLNVATSLDCKISGSGVVMYKGSPRISSKISGSGRLIPI